MKLYQDSLSSEEDDEYHHVQENDEEEWVICLTSAMGRSQSSHPLWNLQEWPSEISGFSMPGKVKEIFMGFVAPRWTPPEHVNNEDTLAKL